MANGKRESGVLMHISSLPGDYSIGSFGYEARAFVDYLKDSGFSIWQILPFCMCDECNSPYKSPASFCANPYFIDLVALYEKGLITKDELKEAKQKAPYTAEYQRLSKERLPLLYKAAMRIHDRTEIINFIKENEELDSACRFLALRDINGSTPWQSWDKNAKTDIDRLFFWQFVQYEFYTEWHSLKTYANEKGIKIIGDLPIYVALESADVFNSPEQFLLDSLGYPTSVAGVPPDYFSSEGQMWGNPLYNWERMAKDNYAWWRRRLEFALSLFDGVRIDHFRGFESYYSVPNGALTAKEGKWVKGPGKDFIDLIKKTAGDKLIIAEDLGDITNEVRELLDYSAFPGMRVLQFAFLGDKKTPHLPHNYPKNCIAYTGTHDNNTLLGYIFEMSEENRRVALSYCGASDMTWESACFELIRSVYASHSDTVILPVQDILGFGCDTRMNTPGTSRNNWTYRITREQLSSLSTLRFKELNILFDRYN